MKRDPGPVVDKRYGRIFVNTFRQRFPSYFSLEVSLPKRSGKSKEGRLSESLSSDVLRQTTCQGARMGGVKSVHL